jgi:hypothetical protein
MAVDLGSVEAVRAATAKLEEAIDREIAARAATEAAALALVAVAEKWIPPRLCQPVWSEAAGLYHDVLEYENPRELVRAKLPDFLELVTLAEVTRDAELVGAAKGGDDGR